MVEHFAEVVVHAPRAQVYLMWERLEDFPQYMRFVEQVLHHDAHRTHWVANIVGRHEWDALDEDWVEGRQIGWRSYAGLRNFGRVTFEDAGPGQTRVRVHITYEPPLGVVGDVGENLGAGSAFQQALQQDLVNFAKMVAQAPPGATDPHLSRYLYNSQSAVAEGRTIGQWPHQEVPREFDWYIDRQRNTPERNEMVGDDTRRSRMAQEPGAQRTTRARDENGDPQRLLGCRVALIATDGVEQVELEEPSKALGTAGAKVTVITHRTQKPGWIQAFKHITPADQIPAEFSIENANPADYDALLLPGGALNADMLRSVPAVVAFIKAMAQAGKPMAVICHAPWELINAELAQGRALTSYHTIALDLMNAGANWVDQEVVVDGNLVTSRQPSDIPAFNREMLRVFERSRQGGEQYGLPQGVEPLPTQPGAMPPASKAPYVPPAEQPTSTATQP